MTDTSPSRATNPWLALGVLLAIYIFSFADRYLVTGLVGPIKAEFKVDDRFMGLLMGPAFVLLYLVAAVPIARLADRASRVRIIAIGCIVWSASTVATGLATNGWMLALSRIGVGAGEAAFLAPAYSLLADFFRPERRGIAFAILGLGNAFGQIAGQAAGPALAAEHGWRMAFHLMGVAGIVLALVLLVMVREPRRAKAAAEVVEQPGFGEMLRELAGVPSYFLIMGAFGLGTLSGVAFAYWAPEMFARISAADPVKVKAAFAIYFGMAGTVGLVGFGAMADRLSRRDPVWPMRLAAIALGSATAFILVSIWAGSFDKAKWIAVPSGLLGAGWPAGMLAMLHLILPDRYRASAMAVFVLFTTLAGYFVAPWLIGELSSHLGDNGASLRMALTLVMPVGFLGAVLAYLASLHIARDRVRLADRTFKQG